MNDGWPLKFRIYRGIGVGLLLAFLGASLQIVWGLHFSELIGEGVPLHGALMGGLIGFVLGLQPNRLELEKGFSRIAVASLTGIAIGTVVGLLLGLFAAHN